MPEINEYARKEVEKLWKASPNYPKFTRTEAEAAADKFGVNVRTIRKWISMFNKPESRRVGRRKPLTGNKGLSLDEFREKYDDSILIPTAIEDGIEKYLKRPDGTPIVRSDKEFMDLCNVISGKWRRYAEEYKHLQVKKHGVLYWAHPDIIDEVRSAVNR